jgi:hypothetical protein
LATPIPAVTKSGVEASRAQGTRSIKKKRTSELDHPRRQPLQGVDELRPADSGKPADAAAVAK